MKNAKAIPHTLKSLNDNFLEIENEKGFLFHNSKIVDIMLDKMERIISKYTSLFKKLDSLDDFKDQKKVYDKIINYRDSVKTVYYYQVTANKLIKLLEDRVFILSTRLEDQKELTNMYHGMCIRGNEYQDIMAEKIISMCKDEESC